MKFKGFAIGLGLVACLFGTQATATVGLKFVEGTSCAASPANIGITTTGGTATVSVCVTSTANEGVCSATYPLLSTNAAANTAGVQVATRTVTAPFTNVLDITVLPATLTTTATQLANGLPAAGVQTGVQGTSIKIAEMTLTIPAGLPGGTQFTYGISGTAEVATTGPGTTDCNDLNVLQTSNVPAAAGFTLVTPAAPPTITISRDNATVNDDGTLITFTVTASQAPLSNLPITLTSGVAGTMTGVSNTCGNTVTILAAATTATCTISATNTVPFDGPATATVTVVAGAGYVVGNPATAQSTINNNDLPTVTLTTSATNIPDNATAAATATITATLSAAAPAGGFSVPLTLPAANARYTTTCGGTINVAAGATTGTCTVTAVANTVVDGNAGPFNFAVNCTNTCTNGNPSSVAITVVDDDVPTVSVAASPTTLTDSAGQTSTITFTTAVASTNPISVVFAPPAASPRYTTDCVSPITIAANATTATCTVTATANTDVGDGTATATVTVQSCTTTGATCNPGNPATANVAINDDDKATITIAAAPTPIAENGGVSTVTITATAPAGGVLTNGQSVSVLLSGTGTGNTSRYTSTCTSPQAVNFTGVATATATCTITAIDNAVVDGDVTATVTLGASASYTVGNPNAANVVITDDEHGITVTPSVASITEGQAAVFNLSCGGTVGTVVVNYTVTGADSGTFSSSITLTCPTGGQVTVPTIDDSNIGNARSVTLTIDSLGAGAPAGTVVGTPASATVLVDDNDRPTVIPTLSELGLLTLLLTMAGVAGFALRRKI